MTDINSVNRLKYRAEHLPSGSLVRLSGRYRYCVRGGEQPFLPDERRDRVPVNGWISLAAGSLFDGGTVGWRGLTVMDQGVDIEFELDQPVFAARLLLDAEALQASGSVSVYAENEGAWRQIGQATPAMLERDEFRYASPGPAWVDLGVMVRHGLIRLGGQFRSIVLRGGLRLVAAAREPLDLFPLPQMLASGGLTAEQAAQVLIAEDDADAAAAAAYFVRHFTQLTGRAVAVRSLREGVRKGAVWIGRSDWQPCEAELPEAPAAGAVIPQMAALQDGSFALTADQQRIGIAAGSRLGLFAGMGLSLRQFRLNRRMFAGTIRETPRSPFRGVHLMLPAPDQEPFFRQLIEQVVVPLRYNIVILEIAGGMRFDRHPEIAETWERVYREAIAGQRPMPAHFNMVAPGHCMEPDQVRELADWMRSFGLDVVPEIQTLSHVQYITAAYPEIGEVATQPIKTGGGKDYFSEDVPPPEDVPSCVCPSHPDSYRIMDDIFDEILDVVRPRSAVHMGHDEVYRIGVCPKCWGKDPAQLLAADINHWHDRLSERGLGMMIWADMLQSGTAYQTPAAIRMIPKDILMLDFIWYFDFDSEFEDRLLAEGFPVLMGNLYSSHYPRYEKRSAKSGMLGGQISTWVENDEAIIGREGKFYDFAYTAVLLWSDQMNRHLRPWLDQVIRRELTGWRRQFSGVSGWTEPGLACDLLATHPRAAEAAGDPLAAQLRALLPDQLDLDGLSLPVGRMSIALPPEGLMRGSPPARRVLEIPVDARLNAIHLILATRRNAPRIVWQDLREVGQIRVMYEDGGSVVVPLLYGGNIMVWNYRYAEPMQTNYYRHQGYVGTYFADPVDVGFTPEGSLFSPMRIEWRNPEPGRKIRGLSIVADERCDAGILVFAVAGVTMP